MCRTYPIFAVVGLACSGAGYYLYRLSQGPEVVWNRHSDWKPWNKIEQHENVSVPTSVPAEHTGRVPLLYPQNTSGVFRESNRGDAREYDRLIDESDQMWHLVTFCSLPRPFDLLHLSYASLLNF